ncbi:C39 family peptidase [Micromonospora sp. NPDC000207]|uniref:C39 family peptidase n=1 Tax=Micromonospora sp. NPDC000207 TaxID=3154246 RepID=UPI003318993C
MVLDPSRNPPGTTDGAVAVPVATPQDAGHPSPAVQSPTIPTQTGRRPQAAGGVDIRYEAQATFFYCGPAATRHALSVRGTVVDQETLARELGTTEAGTGSLHDVVPVLNREFGDGTYRITEIAGGPVASPLIETLRADVVRTVSAGRAVVANTGGTGTDTSGTRHTFAFGHYVCVVGYAEGGRLVTIADSADPARASYLMTVQELARWMAGRGYAH